MHQLFAYFKRFSPLSEEAQKVIEAISTVVHIQKNKDLQRIGHTCKTVYFINKGLARIYYFKDGTDITDSFSFENNIIVRVESLFTGKPSRKPFRY
jgi:CRP-like cAMP-binding protein